MGNLTKNLPVIVKREKATIYSFIKCWKRFYEPDESKDKIYFDNLKTLNELKEDIIEKLFIWKNGMPLSGKKLDSVNKIKDKLDGIKEKFAPSGGSINELEKIYNYSFEFFENGYIWNLFFLHILKYETCPIADMYAYRAFNYMCNGENELPVYNWDTYTIYMDFFNSIGSETNRKSKKERKEIDDALWGFGKFLSSGYAKIITEET